MASVWWVFCANANRLTIGGHIFPNEGNAADTLQLLIIASVWLVILNFVFFEFKPKTDSVHNSPALKIRWHCSLLPGQIVTNVAAAVVSFLPFQNDFR